MKKKIIIFLGILLMAAPAFISPVAAYATTDNYVDVSDDDYKKTELLTILEDELRKIGLSLKTFANTGIDFENMTPPVQARAFAQPSAQSNELAPKSSVNFPQVKSLAKKLYGSNPTNDQLLYTFMAYYIDVYDYDRNVGKFGLNLPYSYFPEYLTENDTNAYDAFFRTVYGKKWIEFAKASYDAAKGIGSGMKAVSNISVEELNKRVTSISDVADTLQSYLELTELKEDLEALSENTQELIQIHSPEGMMELIDKKVSAKNTLDQAKKDIIKDSYRSVFTQVLTILAGSTPAGLLAVTVTYETALVPLYMDIYDRAAINTLHYTRSLRLTLREYASWGF
jgi:hypothetical protein